VRELAIFIGALMVWPLVLGVITAREDSYIPNISYILTRLIASLTAPGLEWFTIAALLISPYLAIQTVRAFRWSKRSLFGRKWANLYFSALFAACATWFAWRAWDLLYFMYMLGDFPEEIWQFVEIEGAGVVLSILSIIMFGVCLHRFFNPRAGLKSSS
jgi:hypothetical protein